jgi:Flp pilus assembly pilin Flp
MSFLHPALARLILVFVTDRRANAAVEYALIASLVAVVITSALVGIGHNVATTFNKVASEL